MKCISAAFSLLATSSVLAQSSYTDITVVALTSDTLEVRLLRPYDTLDSLLSITFTLGWDTAGNVQVGPPDQFFSGPPFCEFFVLPVSESPDGMVDVDGVRHVTYNGFGTATLPPSCDALVANVEYSLVRIPVISNGGCANINVVNDTYTAANNKDYYFSNAGIDRTGVIYGAGALDMGDCTTEVSNTGLNELPSVWPNPVGEQLNLNTHGSELLSWRLIDASGREVASATTSGITHASVDVSKLPAGAYGVELRTHDEVSRHHVVIAR